MNRRRFLGLLGVSATALVAVPAEVLQGLVADPIDRFHRAMRTIFERPLAENYVSEHELLDLFDREPEVVPHAPYVAYVENGRGRLVQMLPPELHDDDYLYTGEGAPFTPFQRGIHHGR